MSDLPDLVKNWIGKTVVKVDHTVTVERGLWLTFCAAVQDGNPLYWEDAIAQEHTGRVIAPPALLAGWGSELDWYPGKQGHGVRPLELHFMLKEALGLPNGITIGVELEFHEPVHAGDKVQVEQMLRAVGDEKPTRLGIGRKWTIDVVYRRQDQVLLGLQTLEMLAYRTP
jgi:acyl dehydratase